MYSQLDGCIKNGMKWSQILEDIKKIHFEESQKNRHISSSTKSLIEMKDVHIEFDNMNNNDIQNGKLVYII